MNRIVASKYFLRPLHVSRALSAMTQTDSSIVWVNFVAREPMFQYNDRVSRKLYVDMVRRRSSLRFLDRKRSEIAQCILPVKSRFAPKTQPPSKWTWAWHQTLVRPLFLPSSNLWMGFFSRRGYVTCMERLTVPEFRVSEDLVREEEYLLRHPWTGSRLRVPKGITSEMLSEPERMVREDGEPRLLPTIRAAKSNLKTAKQSLLFEQRSEGKTLPYSTNNLMYKAPPEEAMEVPSHPATQTDRRDSSSERECLKRHLGDLLPAPQRPALLPLHYHRDGPTRTLLNQGRIHNVRAKVPELRPRPALDFPRCQTYIVATKPKTRVKVPLTVDEFRKHRDSKNTKTCVHTQLRPSPVVRGMEDPRQAINSRRKASQPAAPSQLRKDTKANNSLQRTKRVPEAAAGQPQKERCLRVPVAVMEFVRAQELLAEKKAKDDEAKARWKAASRKPPAEPVEVSKKAPQTARKREAARVPFVLRDFIEENKHFPRKTTKTWYLRHLRRSSESLCEEDQVPDFYYMRDLRPLSESNDSQNTTRAPVRRAVPPPPAPRTSVAPPKRKPPARVPELRDRRWKY